MAASVKEGGGNTRGDYAVFAILFFTNILNYVDRYTMAGGWKRDLLGREFHCIHTLLPIIWTFPFRRSERVINGTVQIRESPERESTHPKCRNYNTLSTLPTLIMVMRRIDTKSTTTHVKRIFIRLYPIHMKKNNKIRARKYVFTHPFHDVRCLLSSIAINLQVY